MPRATFRFFADLNDFLAEERRGCAFDVEFSGRPAVKDLIESLGVPHPEVRLVLCEGEPVALGWHVADGAHVTVYPEFTSIDVAPLCGDAAPRAGDEARFVLDVHLGRLARYLRMAGFDTSYDRSAADAELARRSAEEHRILVTRDVGLLKRREVTRGCWLRSTDPTRQLAELVRRFRLAARARPLTRCLRCNALLEPVAPAVVRERLPPRVRARQHDFRRCPTCDRIFWAGTHVTRMERLLSVAALRLR